MNDTSTSDSGTTTSSSSLSRRLIGVLSHNHIYRSINISLHTSSCSPHETLLICLAHCGTSFLPHAFCSHLPLPCVSSPRPPPQKKKEDTFHEPPYDFSVFSTCFLSALADNLGPHRLFAFDMILRSRAWATSSHRVRHGCRRAPAADWGDVWQHLKAHCVRRKRWF
jgi:hypothetical protein